MSSAPSQSSAASGAVMIVLGAFVLLQTLVGGLPDRILGLRGGTAGGGPGSSSSGSSVNPLLGPLGIAAQAGGKAAAGALTGPITSAVNGLGKLIG